MIEVFRTDAHNRTVESVATEFALTNWDKPRMAANFSYDPDATYFRVADGIATYAITYTPAVPFETVATWKVSRI